MKAGILALQGDVEEHGEAFRRAAEELGVSPVVVDVKRAAQLKEGGVLAIPGGGRGVPIPVRVELPPLWKEFLDALSPSPASGGLR